MKFFSHRIQFFTVTFKPCCNDGFRVCVLRQVTSHQHCFSLTHTNAMTIFVHNPWHSRLAHPSSISPSEIKFNRCWVGKQASVPKRVGPMSKLETPGPGQDEGTESETRARPQDLERGAG